MQRLGGVVGKLGFHFHAPTFAFGDDVGGLDGTDSHRAAHAGFHAARHGRAFFHRDAAEQRGIDIIAVGDAVVVHPHVHGLLRAVDGNGDAAFAADAADIGRNRAAGVAGVHVVHAV